jgi:hypothetical protein
MLHGSLLLILKLKAEKDAPVNQRRPKTAFFKIPLIWSKLSQLQ